MKVLIDVLIILGLCAGVWLGMRRGFVNSIAKFVRIFASIGLAYLLCGLFADLVIDPIVTRSLKGQISDYLILHYGDVLTPENASEKMPALFKAAATLIDDFNPQSVTQDELIDYLVENLAGPTVTIISRLISFVILYILFSIGLAIALAFADALVSNGPFELLNKILGGVCGFILALAAAWIFCCFFAFLLPLFGEADWISKFGEGGWLYRFLRGHGLLDLLLSF